MSGMSTPVEVFCSCAPEDEGWLLKLETHLALLKQQGLITLWHRRLLSPGQNWQDRIDSHLERASIILLLISADFFASSYASGREMQRALQREAEGSARVIPLLVRQADGKEAPFAHLQPLPKNGCPLAQWQDPDEALSEVAAGVRQIIEQLPQLAVSAPRAFLPTVWNIPYPRNPDFTGREELLSRLEDTFSQGQVAALSQPQAISGLGGIGKTQLAVEYA